MKKVTIINNVKYVILSQEGKTVFLRKLKGKVLNVAQLTVDGKIINPTPLWHTRA